MRRTANHVLSSPNPAQLEMRILANHGADSRFAFLKGRWARAWRLAKAHAQSERTKAAQEKAGLGGLAGYDSESSGSNVPVEEAAQAEGTPVVVEDQLKAARRARAKEWAEKRRLATTAEGT